MLTAMIPTLLVRCRAALVAAFWPRSDSNPSETIATRTCLHPVHSDMPPDDSSLFALAEAIARKISRHRAEIGQDGVLEPAVSQEVCRLPSSH
ncbi:hypothetical protein BJV78DRAFT_206552 [Lactifluus subvellereus]|nr:hypothetical protein BJV78DRAFT_206552 [Lactifluus subvellereus]